MLIDFHTHTFADRLCPNAVGSLAEKANLHPYTDGSMKQTQELMRSNGVDKFVSLNIAVNPHTQPKVNDYAISINGENVYAFGSIHPDSPDWKMELNRLKEAGIKGIKFHNEYQNFYVDDEKAFPLYEEAIKNDMIIVFHGGEDLGFPPPFHATPERMRNVYNTFNYDKFILAHMGGYNMLKDAVTYLADTEVKTDTSFSVVGKYTNKQMEYMIDAFTPSRVLFGSDCPWDYPKQIFELIDSLKYSKEEKELIYCKNAMKLLKI